MTALFEKRVKSMQKWVLGGLVGLMVISLVTWGFAGQGPDSSAGDKPAGSFVLNDNSTVTVTRREFDRQRRHAVVYGRHRWLQESEWGMRLVQNIVGTGWRELLETGLGGVPKETDEAIAARTWEMLVLLRDANMKGLRVSEAEVAAAARQYLEAAKLDNDRERNNFKRLCGALFSVDHTVFEDAMRECLVIDKLLDLHDGGSPVPFSEVSTSVAQGNIKARVRLAPIDPARFTVRVPSDEAIRRRYEERKSTYEMPEKVQIEYLLADSEAEATRQPEPTADEIQKYYDDNKNAFEKDHTHAPGQDHDDNEPKQYKTIDEARAEIVTKLRKSKATKVVLETMRDVNRGIGRLLDELRKSLREPTLLDLNKELPEREKEQEALKAEHSALLKQSQDSPGDPDLKARVDAKDAEVRRKVAEIAALKAKIQNPDGAVKERVDKTTGDMFAKLREEYRARMELTHDITTLFDMRHIDEAWKAFGKPVRQEDERQLTLWFFSGGVGSISLTQYETAKGRVVLRIARKAEKYQPDLNEPIRARIARELAEEDVEDRADKLASQVQQDIEGAGLDAIARRMQDPTSRVPAMEDKYGIAFRRSHYFGQMHEPGDASDLGLGEAILGSRVRMAVFPTPRNNEVPSPPAPGQVFILHGHDLGADKKQWAYVGVVEDVMHLSADRADQEFDNKLRDLEDKGRADRRQRAVNALVGDANIDDKTKTR